MRGMVQLDLTFKGVLHFCSILMDACWVPGSVLGSFGKQHTKLGVPIAAEANRPRK